MFALLVIALFAAAALCGIVVLADSAVRSRNAFRQLHGQLARLDGTPRISVNIVPPLLGDALPALRVRAVSAPRQVRRRAPSRAPIRHAAA